MIVSATKFYRPTRADLTGKERRFAEAGLSKMYRCSTKLDVPDFDFLLPSAPRPIMTRRIAQVGKDTDFDTELMEMGPFQVTYNFSSAVRDNTFPTKIKLPLASSAKGTYGASGWSYRMLYEFLCEVYNSGEPFIDTYFKSVFKTRPAYRRFLAVYDEIRQDVNAEQLDMFMNLSLKADGTPDMRFKESKEFKDFAVWQKPLIKEGCRRVASEIRRDIEICLRTGKLPLRGRQGAAVSRKTQELRRRFVGLHANRLFYASGRLIGHLNIYVEVDAKEVQAA